VTHNVTCVKKDRRQNRDTHFRIRTSDRLSWIGTHPAL